MKTLLGVAAIVLAVGILFAQDKPEQDAAVAGSGMEAQLQRAIAADSESITIWVDGERVENMTPVELKSGILTLRSRIAPSSADVLVDVGHIGMVAMSKERAVSN